MPRHIPPSMSEELDESTIRPAWLIELQFANGYVWLWTGRGTLDIEQTRATYPPCERS